MDAPVGYVRGLPKYFKGCHHVSYRILVPY